MTVVADVFRVLAIDEDGDVIGRSLLQDANIEVTVQSNDVNAGQGNELIGVLRSGRQINIAWSDIEFDMAWTAKQFGQDVITSEGVAYAMPKWYLAKDNEGVNSIELENTPATVHEMKVYNKEGKKVNGFTVSGKTVDFTAATPVIPAGEEVEVRTYIYNTPAETQSFFIDNKVFAKGIKVVLETLEVEPESDTPIALLQYEFYKAIPDGNFTFNTAAERSAQAMSSTLRVVKPRHSDVVGVVKRIPIED
ncbi:hypothetical protein P4571_07730 [Niallia alba]|uniref:hypothetical protein n=1 Tax=Niallia alba TaxID=2729105 RepID=UPI002E23C36B|nr:hypothetical protein [Niallia alba]